MQRLLWSGLVSCLLLGVGVASARESDELRERAAQLKNAAAELMQRGEKAKAQLVIEEAAELVAKANKLDQQEKALRGKSPLPDQRERELQRLHARLKELHTAHRHLWETHATEEELVDVRFLIRRVEAQIEARRADLPGPGPTSPHATLEQLEAQLHRIGHLRKAAEHLRAADMPEPAQHLREKAEEMERDAHAAIERLEREAATLPQAPLPAAKSVEQSLREEIESLRNEVEKLRRERKQP